jgi:hypothetical protein
MYRMGWNGMGWDRISRSPFANTLIRKNDHQRMNHHGNCHPIAYVHTYIPGAHCPEHVDELSPFVEPYVDAGHAIHCDKPVTSAYFPRSHNTHVVCPIHYIYYIQYIHTDIHT